MRDLFNKPLTLSSPRSGRVEGSKGTPSPPRAQGSRAAGEGGPAALIDSAAPHPAPGARAITADGVTGARAPTPASSSLPPRSPGKHAAGEARTTPVMATAPAAAGGDPAPGARAPSLPASARPDLSKPLTLSSGPQGRVSKGEGSKTATLPSRERLEAAALIHGRQILIDAKRMTRGPDGIWLSPPFPPYGSQLGFDDGTARVLLAHGVAVEHDGALVLILSSSRPASVSKDQLTHQEAA